MKNFFKVIFLLAILGIVYVYHNDISNFLITKYISTRNVTLNSSNDYKKDANYGFVKQTNEFHVKDYQNILDTIYTVLNNGWDEFKFYCDTNYKECITDVESITDNDELISHINNYVHPYNNYDSIQVTYNQLGEVTININKLYNNEEIAEINKKIDEVYNSIITNDMSNYDKIKTIHDYIINNTVYDNIKGDFVLGKSNTDSIYKSHKAYGPLLQGYAICSGYSDAMAIFLNKMGIPNYKISSNNHVWNLVYLDNQWLHLDLTWDDPIVSNGENKLTHNFFLIDDNTLKEKNTEQHQYDTNIYKEATSY